MHLKKLRRYLLIKATSYKQCPSSILTSALQTEQLWLDILAGVHCAAAAGNAVGASPPAPAARDVSLLHIGTASALFNSTSASPLRPVPLPLGPAYNTSAAFAAAWNVSAAWALDDPTGLRANETVVGALVRALGTAFYPSGVLFEARHGRTPRAALVQQPA